MLHIAAFPRLILDIWYCLKSVRRRQFILLFLLMIVASFAEVVSIGTVLPFLGALTAPERVFAHPAAQPFIRLFNFQNAQELLLPSALAFCAAALLAGGIRLLLLYTTTRYSYSVGADLSVDIYRRTLYQPYIVHTSRNSSEVINGITGKTAMMTGSVLVPLLSLASSIILLIGILLALLALDPMIAIVASAAFSAIYGTILAATKRSLQRNSECISRESTQVIKALQEGLGGIRDVLINGAQEIYCRIYRQADHPLRLAQGQNTFISSSPRFVIETMGMILIAGLAYAMAQREGGLATAIPVLGALALGAQRLLPILQQSYSALSIIRGAEASMKDIRDLMDQPLPTDAGSRPEPIPFHSEIVLQNVSFRYGPDVPWVLRDVQLQLAKGKRIGFMGATGSGKSTMLDIVMGLLDPTEGMLTIDGQEINAGNRRAWQIHVAHVPQTIYLSDSTIEENIAFGLPRDDVNVERVRLVARQAQIADVIEAWPEKYQTKVGERGVRLSGGQLQRIGIARALYKQADVIIFDEATSALDNETERALMDAIDGLGRELTIFIIAHRLSTLKNCDLIVELASGSINRVGKYNELVSRG